MHKVKVYLGCDLFTQGQRWQAKHVEDILKNEFGDRVEIYNPASNLDINDKNAGFASGIDILLADYTRLRESDILIALMDTQDIGLSAEMGIAFEREIPIFQLYTDIRLGGTDKQDKLVELQKDVFQNDFLYINKLVTGLSYVRKSEENGGFIKLEKPTIYRKTSSLIIGVIEYINELLEKNQKQ